VTVFDRWLAETANGRGPGHSIGRRTLAGAAGDLDGSRGGGVQSTEVVETVFIAEHGGQRSQASML